MGWDGVIWMAGDFKLSILDTRCQCEKKLVVNFSLCVVLCCVRLDWNVWDEMLVSSIFCDYELSMCWRWTVEDICGVLFIGMASPSIYFGSTLQLLNHCGAIETTRFVIKSSILKTHTDTRGGKDPTRSNHFCLTAQAIHSLKKGKEKEKENHPPSHSVKSANSRNHYVYSSFFSTLTAIGY